jgi:hypothetical protein
MTDGPSCRTKRSKGRYRPPLSSALCASYLDHVLRFSKTDFPKRLGEKLKTIREHSQLSPDEIAQFVGANDAAEIIAYEDDEGDLPVSILWGYARLSGNPMMNLIDHKLEVNWTNN